MRKFVSVVAVLAMLFALAMPAFAASEPEGYSVQVTDDVTMQLPEDVYVSPLPEAALSEKQADSIDDAAKANAGADATVGDLFWIDTDSYDGSEGATITVVYDGAGVVAGVLYWSNERGVWDYAAATANADGSYSVTLKHFCAAALVITPKKAAAAPSGSKPAASPASPQTGFEPAGFMMVTATLVLFAGFCFVKARKVTE